MEGKSNKEKEKEEEDEEEEGRFGSEKDKVNCPFYIKIGSCRHGERCSRIHHKPSISKTLLLRGMYQHPSNSIAVVDGDSLELDEDDANNHFVEFYQDIFDELSGFGKIDELNVCDNLGEHLLGNVLVKYSDEESCSKALSNLNGRYYAGLPLFAEFSPIQSLKEARCRQYDLNECGRGRFCNFLHLKKIPTHLQRKYFPSARTHERSSRRRSSSSHHRHHGRHHRSHHRSHHHRHSHDSDEDRSPRRHHHRTSRHDDDSMRRSRTRRKSSRRSLTPSPSSSASPSQSPRPNPIQHGSILSSESDDNGYWI